MRTKACAKVGGLQDFHRQILVDFPNNLYRISRCEMALLRWHSISNHTGYNGEVRDETVWAQTWFNIKLTMPSESMVAVVPRSCVTFPTIRTVFPVKASRYWEVILGVESAIVASL